MLSNSLIVAASCEAMKSEYKLQMGCIIFNKKKILSVGYNQVRSSTKIHPKYLAFKESVHAEVDAIIKARKELKGASLLVVRVNKKHQLRNAKPCNKCMEYIKEIGIKRIYYSISEEPFIISEKV